MNIAHLAIVGFLSSVAALAVATFGSEAHAGVIDFDTPNQLTNDFAQNTGGFPPSAYVQSPTGGIEGGSVTAVSGLIYTATAVYDTPLAFATGSQIQLGLDFFTTGDYTPLAPGANSVRSFRLGLVTSTTSAFETFAQPSVSISGDYSLDLQKMFLSVRSNTGSYLVSGGLSPPAGASILANHWYDLNATFTNEGGGLVDFAVSLFDIGPDGLSSPTFVAGLNSEDPAFDNVPLTQSGSVYAGFAALANGGIARVDDLSVPSVSSVPEPGSLALLASGFIGLVVVARGRRA